MKNVNSELKTDAQNDIIKILKKFFNSYKLENVEVKFDNKQTNDVISDKIDDLLEFMLDYN